MIKIINSLQFHIINAEKQIQQYNEEKLRLHEKLLLYREKLELLKQNKQQELLKEC